MESITPVIVPYNLLIHNPLPSHFTVMGVVNATFSFSNERVAFPAQPKKLYNKIARPNVDLNIYVF